MNHLINSLIICDKDEDRVTLKSFLKAIKQIEIFEIHKLNKIDSVVEIIDELKIDLIFVDLKRSKFRVIKGIKKRYPNMIIMLIDTIDYYTFEKIKVKEYIDAYVKKPILSHIFNFKIKNFINLIKIDRNTALFFKEKSAINLFTKNVRSMKIFYYITNENDMMDFGGWFFDYYYSHAKTMTLKSHDMLEFLYRVISSILQKKDNLTLIIERAFEITYVNIVTPRNVDVSIIEKKKKIYKDNLKYKDGILSLRVKPEEDIKEEEKLEIRETSIIETREIKESHKEKISVKMEIEKEKKKKKKKEKDIFIKMEIQEDEKEVAYIDQQDKDLLRKSFVNKVTAEEFLAEFSDGVEEIEELDDFKKEWIDVEDIFEDKQEFDRNMLNSMASILNGYASIIGAFYTFEGLSHALHSLSNILSNVDDSNLNKNKNRKLSIFLNSFRSDLESWKINIFDEAITQDIHYLDSSLLSSCMNIESLLTDTQIKDDESELELF